jgi:hypothetical protein
MLRCWLAIAILVGSSAGPSAAGEPELATGMPLSTALELLRKHHIPVVEDEGDYAAGPEAREMRRYYVRPAGSPDALYFIAVRTARETSLKLTDLFWWKDWVRDSQRPKALRENRQVGIHKIAIKSLK